MNIDRFEATVGISRKWDAREAGREVARATIRDLSKPPKFFLLFSTIHYEKHGGFKEFLNGVWDVLPESTQLIGGTIAGFISNHGCFTRGTAAMAVSYPNMDVAIGFGKRTKKNPKQAAKQCVDMVKKSLDNSTYKNKLFYSVISGSTVPEFPGFKSGRRIFPGYLGKLAISLTPILNLIGKGAGKEEEILKELSTEIDDYNILTGSCMDSGYFIKDYQFFNKQIFNNSIVGIGIKTDLDIEVGREHGLTQTNKKFNITKFSKDKRFIHKINNKPALDEFLNVLNWPEEFIDERLHWKTLYYPLGIKENDTWNASVVGLVLNKSFLMTHKTQNQDITILSASGQRWIDAVGIILKNQRNKLINPAMGLIISCAVRLEGLGYHIYEVQKLLSDFFKDKPFLGIYVSGEGLFSPKRGYEYGNETFNLATFWSRTNL